MDIFSRKANLINSLLPVWMLTSSRGPAIMQLF